MRLALALLLACLLALPARAGVGDLKTTLSGDGITAAGTGETAFTDGPRVKDVVLDKLKRGLPLTQKEFLVYLQETEKLNPGMTWAHLASKLHEEHYSADATIRLCGIDLFKNGKENEGFEKVKLFGGVSPKFVTGDDGKRVDIAHAFAGVRALVNRNWFTGGYMMGNVNTGWGDSVQVWSDRIKGGAKVLTSSPLFTPGRLKDGAKQFGEASKWKPPDQVRGNDLGMKVNHWLSDHREATLSQAFEAVLYPKKD